MGYFLWCLALLLLVGCGLDEGFEPPLSSDTLAGKWDGTWQSRVHAERGQMMLDLQTTDERQLHGTMTLTGSRCFTTLVLTATLEGVSLSGDARMRQDRLLFFGELSADERSMAGQYNVVRGRCSGDAGQWEVERGK